MIPSTESTTSSLQQRVKEPHTLLPPPRVARYMTTYNTEGYFSQYQTAILLDLSSEDDLNSWEKSMH